MQTPSASIWAQLPYVTSQRITINCNVSFTRRCAPARQVPSAVCTVIGLSLAGQAGRSVPDSSLQVSVHKRSLNAANTCVRPTDMDQVQVYKDVTYGIVPNFLVEGCRTCMNLYWVYAVKPHHRNSYLAINCACNLYALIQHRYFSSTYEAFSNVLLPSPCRASFRGRHRPFEACLIMQPVRQ